MHYDVVIIGAGMSGLAAGIRLAHFEKSVCVLDKHSTPGGLNSLRMRLDQEPARRRRIRRRSYAAACVLAAAACCLAIWVITAGQWPPLPRGNSGTSELTR